MHRVMLIDDDPDVRALLGGELRQRGIEVVEGESRNDAETFLEHTEIDLVVIDGQLGRESGVETVEYFRNSLKSTVPIVFITANFREQSTFEYLTTKLDVALVFYKPIDPDSFCNQILKLIPTFEPSEAIDEDVLDQLAQLRRFFADSLPGKLQALEEAVSKAKSDASYLDSAQSLAHRLHGSAGSYGFHAVSENVARVESLLGEAMDTKEEPLRRYFWREVSASLRDAHLSADRAPLIGAQLLSSTRKTPSLAVLLVDDDVDFLRMAKATASDLMIEMVTAETGAEAVHRARTQAFVAAIIDVHLDEGSDAFDIARAIAKTTDNQDTPIAFISGDGCMDVRVNAVDAGASRFFEKPLTPENFATALQSFVNKAHEERGRVLVVEDDDDTRELLLRLLNSNGYAADGLASAENLSHELETNKPDLLILDIELPRISGIDVCKSLRMSERWGLLPILICTAHHSPKERIATFEAGASDLIPKPIIPGEFLARVELQLKLNRMIRERSEKDSLSGLLSRAPLLEALQREIARCKRTTECISMALIDLDNFKKINDTYGHLEGDHVITKFGALLRHKFRTEDLCGRWGGEEFLVVFPGQDARFATQAMWSALQDFSTFEFGSEETFNVTYTAGIASFPDDGTSIAALLRCADERMYLGKKHGRNTVIGPASLTEASEVMEDF